MLARLLRSAALVCSAILLISFGLFAIDQAGAASKDSQAGIAGQPASAQTSSARKDGGHGRVRKAIDDADHALRSPFDGVSRASSSSWVRRGIPLLLALILYGFGLGFLSRYAAGRA